MRLTSETGVQQDDPLGPLFFALLLKLVIMKLQGIGGFELNTWFLDDCILAGPR